MGGRSQGMGAEVDVIFAIGVSALWWTDSKMALQIPTRSNAHDSSVSSQTRGIVLRYPNLAVTTHTDDTIPRIPHGAK
jgi:hypothetical protein